MTQTAYPIDGCGALEGADVDKYQAQWLLVLWGYWVDKHRVRKTIDTAY